MLLLSPAVNLKPTACTHFLSLDFLLVCYPFLHPERLPSRKTTGEVGFLLRKYLLLEVFLLFSF